jgi:hypothetical protein
MTAQQINPTTIRDTAFWRRLIDAACGAVANEPEWLIEAVLVVQHFDHLTAAERDELLRLAYSVATEHGVAAKPEPDGDSLAIWFGRPEGKQDAERAIRLAYFGSAGHVVKEEAANG